MTCRVCHQPCPPPDRAWAETRTGRVHYFEGAHGDGPYDPALLEAALAHLPVVHEICARLDGMLDGFGRATARARGYLIRLDERLRR